MLDFGINNFSHKTFELLKKGIEAQNFRYSTIANNIANSETPGFKRSSVTFEAQLKRALASENHDDKLDARITNEKHIPFEIPIPWDSVTPKRVLDYASSLKNDGNNVDIDRENTDLSKTTLVYSAMLDLLKQDYNLVNLVLR
jgi:flagellar basal-body rod protein FlgB